MSTAVITGITGQDGSYLAEMLLADGCTVVGLCRRQSSTAAHWRIDHLLTHPNFILSAADLCDQASVDAIVQEFRPNEIYNLAAQSFVPASWGQPVYTGDVDALGVTRVLESVRRYAPEARFVQASSSEMFGDSPPPQDEATTFRPRSPYGVAKVYGYYITRNYRESFGIHASNCIAFNHGSPRRGPEFVEQKVSTYVGELAATNEILGGGLDGAPRLRLGNMTAERDWLHAKDVVRAMRLMADANDPGDFVISSGETHSIYRLCDVAFRAGGFADWEDQVETDPALYRPAEVPALRGDSTLAREKLRWEPQISFEAMIAEMVEAARKNASKKCK